MDEVHRPGDQASELSPDDVLQHLTIQREIGDELPELGVLVLELLQTPHLRWRHPSYFFFQLK